MKNLFRQAHKLTRDIVNKYNVDYRGQFTLCLNYLLEIRKEEIKMLNEKVEKQLLDLDVTQEEIEKVNTALKKYNTLTNDLIKKMYDDTDIRRTMRAEKLWDYKATGVNFEERYKGQGEVKITKQTVWANYGKVRLYFEVTIDKVITLQTFTNIK